MQILKFLAGVALIMIASFCNLSWANAGITKISNDSKLLYVITPSPTNYVFKVEAEVAAATAKDLGYEVKVFSHDNSPVKQAFFFKKAISERAIAIICVNAGADATVASVKLAKEFDIPTILIDREISEQGLAISQITANNYSGAKDVAQLFVKVMNYEGEYIELYGIDADSNAKIRSSAFHEILDQYPNMQMVAVQSANWDRKTAYEKMKELLKLHSNVKGIISANDNMALGAIDALDYLGKKGVHVVSIDGTNEARDAILAGKLTATAMQPIALMAMTAVYQVDKYVEHGTTGNPEKQFIDCTLVTKENAHRLHDFSLR